MSGDVMESVENLVRAESQLFGTAMGGIGHVLWFQARRSIFVYVPY